MNDCIFCKIIKGEIPSYKIYEDDDVYSFLDISPVNPGHTLVIPKKHYENYFNTPLEELNKINAAIMKITKALLKIEGIKGFNLNLNNGSVAGQIVMHTHFHIVPRYENDGLKLWPGKPYEDEEAKIISKLIIEKL